LITLTSGIPVTLEVKDSAYFLYEIQTRLIDLDYSFLLLECSAMEKTELYISSMHVYPF